MDMRRFFTGRPWVSTSGSCASTGGSIELTSYVKQQRIYQSHISHIRCDEVVKTNIIGTMNIVEAAYAAKVKRAVFLSSDKAFSPCGVYGQTKAIGESLFLNANNTYGERGPMFSVTRYGNVAGSNGSVIPKWREILRLGGQIQITDPSCTRFYMTLDESVNLVMNTVDNMKGGELNIPELPAYCLGDLAMAMNAKNPEIIGLPNFEKRHEFMEAGKSSEIARRMGVDELREAIKML